MFGERRKSGRFYMQLKLTYTILPAQKRDTALTREAGGGGIRFVTDQPIERGTELELVIRLPDRKEPIAFRGTVVWCKTLHRKDRGGTESEVGVRFIDINAKDQEIVTQYATLYASPVPDAGEAG